MAPKTKIDIHKLRQFQIIQQVKIENHVDPLEQIRFRVNFLKDFLTSSHSKGLLLGISGGVDSALAGKLCQMAIDELRAENKKNDYSFVAVRLPYGIQTDEADAQIALDFINPDETITVDIKPSVDALVKACSTSSSIVSDYNKGNTKARIRMVTQYTLASERNLLVVGSDQAAEQTTGFYTKFGDGSADIMPLTGLAKCQVIDLMKELNSPESIITKIPTADLLDNKPGQADEIEFGVSYETLDEYLLGKEVPNEDEIRIETSFIKAQHKRVMPVTPFDDWWRH